jgi:hypothetical protein
MDRADELHLRCLDPYGSTDMGDFISRRMLMRVMI